MTERNRNWHTDPLQGGGRSAHDYGRTGPIEPVYDDHAFLRAMVVGAALIAVLVLVMAVLP